MSLKVFACIDASPYAEAVCDGAIWAAKALTAPLGLVHVIDRAQHTQTPDLSGSIGLGSQEVLLQQLAELDEQHSKLALQRGHHILDAAHARAAAAAVAEISEVMRHGPLLESLKALQEETRLLVLGKRGLSSTDAHGQLGMHIEMIIRSMQKPILLTQQRFSAPKRSASSDGWADLLQRSVEVCHDGRPPGDGWKTCDEIAREIGRSTDHVRKLVRAWLAAGQLEKATGRAASGLPIAFYRPKRDV